PLSLHDALPISAVEIVEQRCKVSVAHERSSRNRLPVTDGDLPVCDWTSAVATAKEWSGPRSATDPLAPAAECDGRPDELDYSDGPRSLQKPVCRRRQARARKQ